MKNNAQLALPVIFTSYKQGPAGKEEVKSAALITGFSENGRPNLVIFQNGSPSCTIGTDVLFKDERKEEHARAVYWENCEPTAAVLAVVPVPAAEGDASANSGNDASKESSDAEAKEDEGKEEVKEEEAAEEEAVKE